MQKSGAKLSLLAGCRFPATSSSPVTLLNRLKGWNAPNQNIVNPPNIENTHWRKRVECAESEYCESSQYGDSTKYDKCKGLLCNPPFPKDHPYLRTKTISYYLRQAGIADVCTIIE